MKTDPIYLSDPYRRTMEAKVLEIQPESVKRFRILLDQTVFYPMGGGQPTDQGFISWEIPGGPAEPSPTAKVYQVMMKEGEIWHYLELLKPETHSLQPGQKVAGTLDWDRRYQNMRVHSGGHLVDFALFRLGLVPETLKPLKGDHGKKPFVLYEVSLQSTPEFSQEKLNETVAQLVADKRNLSWEFTSLENLQQDAIYLQPGLPVNKPLRKLTLEGIGSVADGGTLVRNTGEVGKVLITSIDHWEGQVKVNYQV